MSDFEQFLADTKDLFTVPGIEKEPLSNGNEHAFMSHADVQLLKFFLQLKKPKKVLEIGVAAGGSACHFFDCLHSDATLYSVDYNTVLEIPDALATSRGCEAKFEVGYLAKTYHDASKHAAWKTYFGCDISDCIEEIGGEIDFILLDTVHLLPGEFLSYLSFLPFVANNAVLMIHDIALSSISNLYSTVLPEIEKKSYCNLLLFSAIMQKHKYFSYAPIPNMGCVVIDKKMAFEQIGNVLNMLFLDWYYTPPEKILTQTGALLRKYYSEQASTLYEAACTRHAQTQPISLPTSYLGVDPAETLNETGFSGFDIHSSAAFTVSIERIMNISADYISYGAGHPLIFSSFAESSADCNYEEYCRRAQLVRIRALVSEQEFSQLVNAPLSATDIEKYYAERLTSLRLAALKRESQRIGNTPIYFWGHGIAYENYKHVFRANHPIAMLDNLAPASSNERRKVDGLDLVHPELELPNKEPVPIVIFARDVHVPRMLDYLKKEFPEYYNHKVIICGLC
ncbi:MAG: hypothetical protein BCS36_08815 [Desulfovibrio sp. MES5]|uniref:class I SAM-dependent methyltransferase n=1 Tax=Desulfovibrio sp. MES5 TaxID=1899016 RepID=UPI000B9D2F50|nr:class I SAM-dependent methyltransferase [Desulfovibrio sp. MES5]OXS28840.1 MAG: hypothetical protein BCS36_08815 [Desulfovibrio sp. MES5]